MLYNPVGLELAKASFDSIDFMIVLLFWQELIDRPG